MDLGIIVVVAVPMLVLGAVLVGLGRRTDVVPRREWRLVQATRLLGLLVGGYAAFGVMSPQNTLIPDHWVRDYGVGAMLAPAVFGLVVIVFVALGETLVRPRRAAGPRTASLRPRSPRDYLPRPTTVAVGAVSVTLAATLVLTTLTAAGDRSLGGRRVIRCATEVMSSSRGPYPGSFYSAPLALVLLAVLAVAALAARQVVRRPRGFATTDHGDDVLRRRSLTVIVAAVGATAGLSQTGIGWVTSSALLGLDQTCAPDWTDPVGVTIAATAVASFLVALWCLVRIVSNDSLERPWT